MKHIKPYQLFEASASAAALTAVQITWLDKCVKGSWELNPQTGLVDINGYFDCKEQRLTDLKGVKFGKVSGDFLCRSNQLTSLVGAPQSVGVNFNCYGNALTSLEGAPQIVGKNFYCDGNQLTSLEGAPQSVGGNFWCGGNQLTSLVGAPQTGNGGFWCGDNPVSGSTLKAIFALMQKGKSYQQALEERWPEMGDEDRVLMYKEMPNLSPEDIRKYKALATYNNIKNYL